jgi:uncharacterized protein YkwD
LNYFDIISVLVILLFAVFCYYKGFIKSLLMIAVWGGALALAICFYPSMGDWLQINFLVDPQWLNPLAFAVLFCLGALVGCIPNMLINKWVPAEVHRKPINKISGILPGLALGWCAALLITKLSTASTLPGFSVDVSNSFFAQQSAPSTDWLEGELAGVFTPPIEEKIASAKEEETNVPDAEQFKSSHYVGRPHLEQEMLQLINAERRKHLLKPLQADTLLRAVAVLHGADMLVRGYFSHRSPEGLDPFARMKQASIRYRTAGENLAHASSLPLAHNGLMNSQSHRENILNPRFGRLGIAILDAGTKGLIFVQEFRD